MELFKNFWKNYPALYFGLCLLIGANFALHPSWALLALLSSFLFFRKEILLSIFVALFGFFYLSYSLPPQVEQNHKMTGSGLFQISSISPSSSFQKRLLYRGEFLYFTTADKTFEHLPVFVFLNNPKEESRPKATHLYHLSGELTALSDYLFFFKPEKKQVWKKEERSFSLVELRYKVKKKISSFLEEKITHPPSFAFLNGLIVGDLDDRYLKFAFARLGMQHVMAISGSHFALLIFLISLLLHRFLTKRTSLFLLLLFVNLYYLFIGPTPSIQRAYFMTQLLLIAQIFSKRNQSLNALGVSLFLAILFDPLIIMNIGFQLSFLCTGALLLATPLFSDLFSSVFRKRNEAPSIWHKVGYKSSLLVKESLSLACAINLWILPLLLYDFHKFPLLSLVYNLFFPLLSFVPLLLLLVTFIVHLLIPFAAPFFYFLTTFCTKAIIDLVLYPPSSLEMVLYTPSFPLQILSCYWGVLFLGLIYWREKRKITKEFLPYL